MFSARDLQRAAEFLPFWAAFLCTVIIFLVVGLPIFRAADSPPSSKANRQDTLDGLRGFLALAVFFHHGAYYLTFLAEGKWRFSASHFHELLGPTGVAVFFMITGYLFWSKLLLTRGKPAWMQLYIGRLFRIAPLYIFAVISLLAGVLISTGPQINVPAGDLIAQIATWFNLGITMAQPDINGLSGTTFILAGVTWSLHYEWLFYGSLPLLALFARHPGPHLVMPAATAVAALVVAHFATNRGVHVEAIYVALFAIGMTVASLHAHRRRALLPNGAASVVVLLCFAAALTVPQARYTITSTIVLGVAFYLIASGCTVFGLLATQSAKRLGDISFGIYLLQGISLAALLRPEPFRALALGSPVAYWALLLCAGLILVALATVTHALIERPGIRLGRRVSDAIKSRSGEDDLAGSRSARATLR